MSLGDWSVLMKFEKLRSKESDKRIRIRCEWVKDHAILTLLRYREIILSDRHAQKTSDILFIEIARQTVALELTSAIDGRAHLRSISCQCERSS